MYVYSWFIVLTESLLTVRLAVSEIKPVQSQTDRQTDGQTDRRTDRNVNYSNSRCACARGLIINFSHKNCLFFDTDNTHCLDTDLLPYEGP